MVDEDKICLTKLSKKLLLLHDNARPHTASQTVETINHLGFEVLEHPAYSPDLASSDYRLFGPLKNALRGRRFSTDKEVREAARKWLRDQPKAFFLEGIHKLVDRCTQCIEKEGDYVEK
jgi:histone-lysine N-methyltransferase SETMAR